MGFDQIIELVLPGIPNFIGFMIGVLMLFRILNRLLDMIEKDHD